MSVATLAIALLTVAAALAGYAVTRRRHPESIESLAEAEATIREAMQPIAVHAEAPVEHHRLAA